MTSRPPTNATHPRSLAFLTDPNVWIECAEPQVLVGPYGVRRAATWVGVWADDPERLQAALTAGEAG